MARKEKYDKLLAKYLQLGLNVAGSVIHKKKDHWLLLGDTEACYLKVKSIPGFNLIVLANLFINKLR